MAGVARRLSGGADRGRRGDHAVGDAAAAAGRRVSIVIGRRGGERMAMKYIWSFMKLSIVQFSLFKMLKFTLPLLAWPSNEKYAKQEAKFGRRRRHHFRIFDQSLFRAVAPFWFCSPLIRVAKHTHGTCKINNVATTTIHTFTPISRKRLARTHACSVACGVNIRNKSVLVLHAIARARARVFAFAHISQFHISRAAAGASRRAAKKETNRHKHKTQ